MTNYTPIYNFKQKWNENTSIDWQKKSRIQLNLTIEDYNQWQINGFLENEKQRLLAKIEYQIQTIGAQDGGGGYLEELQDMKQFVQNGTN